MSSKLPKPKQPKSKGKEQGQGGAAIKAAAIQKTSIASAETITQSVSSDEAELSSVDGHVDIATSSSTDVAESALPSGSPCAKTQPQEVEPETAIIEEPVNTPDGPCTVLRDDEDCFLADFTKSAKLHKENKFELWDPFKRGRIAVSLVEMDPDVTLRIRSAPGLDASEVGIVHAGDVFDVAGRCGFWLRICGDDERWVLERTDDLVLVEILPSSNWGLSWGRSLLTSWGGQGSPSGQGKKEREEVESPNDKSSSGWGLGLLSKKVTEYVPSVSSISISASAVASNAVSKILAAGAEDREEVIDSTRKDEENVVDCKGVVDSDCSSTLANHKTVNVDDNGVELDQGGLAPVRIVSQGITYIEGTLGWLGGVAGGVKAAAMDSSTMLLSDDMVDKAWEGVKGTAKASKNVVCGSTEAICHVTELGRAALVNVAEAVLPVATGSSKDLFPNRSLGGVLAIELCGAMVQRDPLADEDDDPFQSDDYTTTPPIPGSFSAIARLVEERFQLQVYVVTVAEPAIQAKLLRWMAVHDVYAKCRIPRENMHMCRDAEEKEDVLRELGATHAIESSAETARAVAAIVDSVRVIDGEGDAEAMVEWWRKLAEELLPLQIPPEEPEGQQQEQQEQQEQQGRIAAQLDAADQDDAGAAETRKSARAETGEV